MNEIHKTIINMANAEIGSTTIAKVVGRSLATVNQVIIQHADQIQRTCSKCGQTKDLTKFARTNDSKYGRRRDCSACRQTGAVEFKLPFSCQKWA